MLDRCESIYLGFTGGYLKNQTKNRDQELGPGIELAGCPD